MRFLGTFAAVMFATAAHASMQDAVTASSMLRDIADSRVVRLNTDADTLTHDQETYGVVFSFEDYGWFYGPEFGNRILGTVAPFPPAAANLQDRLRSVGIPASNVLVYPRSNPATYSGQVTIQNGCVIGALSLLKQRLIGNEALHEAALVLLSYHTEDAERSSVLIVDHCVLVFREINGWRCLDPRRPDQVVPLQRIEVGTPVDSALMAIALRPFYPLKSARLLPIRASTLNQIMTAALWRTQHLGIEPES